MTPAAVVMAVGSALPPGSVSNRELTGRLDTTDEWIRSRTGITRRHIAGADLSTADLAVRAAAKALTTANSTWKPSWSPPPPLTAAARPPRPPSPPALA